MISKLQFEKQRDYSEHQMGLQRSVSTALLPEDINSLSTKCTLDSGGLVESGDLSIVSLIHPCTHPLSIYIYHLSTNHPSIFLEDSLDF